MASQASQLPRQAPPSLPQQQHHHLPSTSYNTNYNGINTPVAIPRRRVSYLIPPPPASQPPPLLMLPTGTPRELKARKRGNPNPLIMLADPDALALDQASGDGDTFDSPRLGSSAGNDGRFSSRRRGSSQAQEGASNNGGLLATSLTASSSISATTSTSSRHYHSNNTTVQRHPEHTLGITALALDTSTIIDHSSSPSRKKTPGGILYSGGRDGLVASWELALPFKKRDPEEGFLGGKGRHRRKRYLPRWAEDTYADDELQNENEDEEDDDGDESYSSSDEESANAAAADGRNKRNLNIHQDPYEDVESEELLLGDDGGGYQASSPPLNYTGSSPRMRSDATTFGQSGISSGLQLDLNRQQRERRRRSMSSSYKPFTIAGQQKSAHNALPYENRWRLDTEQLEARNYQQRPTTFRQAHRSHTNWVNDIVLCNLNQTVISASSDRMIRAWNPHDPHRSMLPAVLGSHNDYVKCLTYARESGWVASGGFDRRIKIWDVMESRAEPISEYDMSGSVYALASNPSGSTIVAGSPEKVVRIFDPRAARGSNPVAGLVGHADNVRALLVSEDGRHVLSASSDSTVKVWSVSMRRCLHTFTHHSDSVWSLFSSHPHLEVFYSGDRTGTVCKVDFENAGDISTEGECVILLRNRDESKPGVASSNDGIHRIVALDDTYLWTASNSSNICRWKDIPRKSKRQAAAVVPPVLTRQDTVLASAKHYPASIPEHDERDTPSGSVASPIPILGTTSEEYTSSGLDRLNRARSNSNMSRDRGPGSQHSVAFATSPFQRSSPQAGSPFSNAMQLQQHQRPSSLRYSANNKPRSTNSFSSSPTANTFSPTFSPPPRSAGDDLFATALTTPNTPLADNFSMPSHNGIPLESLVPLFTANDPYGQTSGYGLGSAVGYSASVLSLHRTASRPMPGTATSPFGLGQSYPTPPSSGLSLPRAPLGFNGRSVSPMPNGVVGTTSTSYQRPTSLVEDEDAYLSPNLRSRSEAFQLAQQEYEDRETAIDGTPLRSAPDDVIRGRSGLVRAELLNDRRTVISLDTQGEVAVWDIILGSCIGRFPKNGLRVRSTSLLSQASTVSDGTVDTSAAVDGTVDILETIRNQIEGEALVQSWCTVECRTGLLTVHIEQGRAFDAEVYLDEAGVPPKPEYRVDQRLNLGKWILRNLFDPFVQEEAKLQTRRNRSGSATGSEGASSIRSNDSVEELSMKSSSVTPAKVPSHISLPDAAEAQAAGFSTALATPAMTPAVLPDQSDLATQFAAPRLMPSAAAALAQLSPIPQSPATGQATGPATPSSVQAKSEGDYFSRPTTTATDAPPLPNGGGLPTPKAVGAVTTLPAVPSSSPATKFSKMSRFKSFGKKDSAKKELAASEAIPEQGPSAIDNAIQADKSLEGTPRDAHLTPLQRAQQSLLRAVFSHPLQPSSWHETPPVAFGADLPVMIEEESHDAGAWATVFRSNISLMLTELSLLEMTMPPWLLEFLCHNVAHNKDPVKIAFILEPHNGPEEARLSTLPSGNARLSATRMLRMRKACHYVAEKLELESWKQRQRHQAALEERNAANGGTSASLTRTTTKLSLSSSTSSYTHLQNAGGEDLEEPTLLPEDEVEILCNGEPVPLNITLAACAKFCYGKSGDVYLTYRRRELDSNM